MHSWQVYWRKRSMTSLSMCNSVQSERNLMSCSLSSKVCPRLKKDKLPPQVFLSGLQLFQCHQNWQSLKLWVASSFNLANMIRLGAYSVKVTTYNSVCTQLCAQSCIFLPNTVPWYIIYKPSKLDQPHYGWLFPQYHTFCTPVLIHTHTHTHTHTHRSQRQV